MSIFKDYRNWKNEHPVGGYVADGLIVTSILRLLGLRSVASWYGLGYFLVVPLVLILSCFVAPCMVEGERDPARESPPAAIEDSASEW